MVDSLNLKELTKADKMLLDSSLLFFHEAKNDSSKIISLNIICEKMISDEWTKYQFFQNTFVKNLLIKNPDKGLKKFLLYAYAGGLNNIGIIYENQGNIPLALENYHKGLRILEIIGDKKGASAAQNNIGTIHYNQDEVDLALEFYHKSLKIKEAIGDKSGASFTINNIGFIHFSQGNYELALESFLKCLEIDKSFDDKKGIAQSYNNIGGVHSKRGDTLLALSYFYKSLTIRDSLNDKPGMAQSYNNIAGIQLKQGALNQAKETALKSLHIAQEIGFPKDSKKAAQVLSVVYEKQGNGMKALEMHKLYITMRDSLNNENTQTASVQQQARYEYEKQKVLDDAEHDKLLAIEHKEKEKQKILTGATAGGLGLVIVFLIFVFNRLKVTKKQKLVIEEQKQEVEQQKTEVELAHHELEEKNQEILDSITYAKRIQSAILPPIKVVKEYLKDSFILYKPKDIVAGDFYWLEHRDGKVLFSAADCTGHGVPGAMVSVVCNNALNRSVREHGLTDPGEILNKTRELIVDEFEKSDEDVKDGMDIALCSLEGNELHYAGAHNPLWIIRNGELLETKANKQPIGKFDNPEPYTTHTFELQKEDSIYIFSDGYVDQFGGEKGKKFKTQSFRELLLNIQNKTMEEQKTIIDKTFETWKGSLDQIDDVCVIGVRI